MIKGEEHITGVKKDKQGKVHGKPGEPGKSFAYYFKSRDKSIRCLKDISEHPLNR